MYIDSKLNNFLSNIDNDSMQTLWLYNIAAGLYPCYFIRFNPDSQRWNEEFISVDMSEKNDLLIRTIDECITNPIDIDGCGLMVYKLFYDQVGGETYESRVIWHISEERLLEISQRGEMIQ